MNFLELFIPACFACFCNALANMFWKLRFNKVPFSLKSISDFLLLLSSGPIWIGVGFYGISMLLFFYMLSNFKLSVVTPVLCMTYVFNILVAKIIFNEPLGKMQIIGTVIIMIGLIVLSRENVIK